jgi:hypothetical protein
MPNWVYNTLTVQGDQLNLARLKKQVGESFTRKYKDYKSINGKLEEIEEELTLSNPIFAFWNISKPKDMDAYLNAESTGIPDNPDDQSNWFQSDNWYDWNIRNWGTKWDVANTDNEKYLDTELIMDEDTRLQYSFNTAWSPPLPAMKELSLQYPTLKINLDYEEETGWGGEIEFHNGEMQELEEYGWKCRECDHTEDETPYCDDCNYDMCPSCGYGEPSEECEKHKEAVNG